MTYKSGEWRYARVVNQQINPNLKKRNKWSNIANAVGSSSQSASAQFTVKLKNTKLKGSKLLAESNRVYNYPYVVTAHDFGLDIPDNANITKVQFQVSMKASKDGTGIDYPRGLVCIYGGGWGDRYDNTKKKETGFHNGLFLFNPKKNLTNGFDTCTYTVEGDNLKKADYIPRNLNATVCGIDLMFDDEKWKETTTVYIQWVRIRVYYDMPNLTLKTYINAKLLNTTESAQFTSKTGVLNTLQYELKSEKAPSGKQYLRYNVPFGTSLVSKSISKGKWNNEVWEVSLAKDETAIMTLQYIDYTVDEQVITLEGLTKDVPDSPEPHAPLKPFYYHSDFGNFDDYGILTTQVISSPIHKRHDACFLVTGKVETSRDNRIHFDVLKTGGFEYENLGDNNTLQCELDINNTTKGVELVGTTSDTIDIYVPDDLLDDEIQVCFRYCIRPLVTGDYSLITKVHGGGDSPECLFTVYPSYEYHFGGKSVFDEVNNKANYLFNWENVRFGNHRIASKLETGAYVLPCKVKDSDAVMIQSKPNIHMYKWEDLDYIGCVPLEHLHFDPKSTYKDKLLDNHYKNKRYMGKELASDEDITLNVRLHPKQVTTIQGLIDMDKPIPINANHRLFEGDSLNHRGWAEIYGITTTLTNPHWYKCDIDVKYLTHNLDTRFKINKGDKSFSKYTIPPLLVDSVSSGEAISDSETAQDYFIVDTDGGYIYNSEEIEIDNYTDENGKIVFFVVGEAEEQVAKIIEKYGADKVNIIHGETEEEFLPLLDNIENEGYSILNAEVGEPIQVDGTIYTNENQRNVFTLDEGQHFTIQSREALSGISQATLDWSTSLLSENKENAISKIIRLKNKTDNTTIFEYEYTDFDFSNYESGDGLIDCHVIGRAYRKGDYEIAITEDIQIPVIVDNDDDESVESDTVEEFYGSTLTFQLNNHNLNVIDTGYSGRELNISNILLEGESYVYEVEWVNNNTDAESGDITAFIDLNIQDSMLSSKYSEEYENMIVSPFPVAKKDLIFSRNAEEGVIYYYKDDKEEFSYLIEPYYQYHNGVDLRASPDGTGDYISIFNLNYGYRTVYLENGLVSLGINRLNGQMYLRKWNDTLKRYVTLFTFQLSHYDDVNINSISDDRIELQASNTLISMYRGHPYVILKHQGEDISILNKFGRVWCEQVNNQSQYYPSYFDLLNTQNLLPECVGGTKGIDDDCVEVFECGDTGYPDCPQLTDVSMELNLDTLIYIGEETGLSVTSQELEAGDIVYFIIDGDVLDDKPMTYPTPVTYTFDDDKEHEISAVYVGDEDKSYAVAPTVTIGVKQPVPEPPTPTPTPTPVPEGCEKSNPTTGKYKLTINAPKKFTYMDGQTITYTLTRGGVPVCKKTIEKIDFNNIHSNDTNSKGVVTSKNNDSRTHPKKYKIGASFHDYENGRKVTTVYQDVTVSKAKTRVTIIKAGTVGNKVKFLLEAVYSDRTVPLKNKKVTVYIDGVKKTAKTNDNGRVGWKITKKGNHSYKFAYAGSENYIKCSGSGKEKVKKSNG